MKRFAGFILLGVAAVEFLTSFIYIFLYPFEFSGLPASFSRMFTVLTLTIIGVVTAILVIVAIVILIKGER
jgi:hypothetical protein